MGLAPLSLACILVGAVVVAAGAPVTGAVLALVGLAFELFLFLADGAR